MSQHHTRIAGQSTLTTTARLYLLLKTPEIQIWLGGLPVAHTSGTLLFKFTHHNWHCITSPIICWHKTYHNNTVQFNVQQLQKQMHLNTVTGGTI